MASLRIALLTLFILALFILGCSSQPSSQPASPDLSGQAGNQVQSSHHLWGMWQVEINSITGDIEIVPLRGAMFNVNVQQFLSPPYVPTNHLGIVLLPETDLGAGYVECLVSLTHPFLGIEMYKGFDVRGIFMGDGTWASDYDSSIKYGSAATEEPYMLNADGFTRWWNSQEFTDPLPLFAYKPGLLGTQPEPTATLNPYKYFADGLAEDQDVSELDTAFRGVFTPTTQPNSRIYQIQFPTPGGLPVFNFNYAIDASWEDPDHDYAPEFPIESFGPGAQCQEAYHVTVDDTGTDAWYYEGNSDGSVILNVEVFDWQGATNSIGVAGEIAAIRVESPVLTNPVDIFPSATPSPGGPTSSVFTAELTGPDLLLFSAGEFPLFGSVESLSPDSYQPQLDGGGLFIFPDGPLAAYFMGTITISGNPGQLAPTVLSVDPDEGYVDWKYEDVVITGQYFQSGATIEFIKNDDPSAILTPYDTRFISDTELNCDFDFDSFADPSIIGGTYNVVVTNPDMLTGQLDDGFELTDLPCAPNEWGEDFDSYFPGQYPTGWTIFWSGSTAYVVDTQYNSSPNGFMQRAYSSWARYDGYPFSLTGKSFVCYETKVLLTDVTRRALCGFAWHKTSSTTGHCGIIVIGDPGEPDNVQPYTWYTVHAKLDFVEEHWRVWVDDELVRDGAIPVSSGYNYSDVTHFFVGLTNFSGSGLSEGYWDDVWLYWE